MPLGPEDEKIERSVLPIGLEQPVEAEERGEKRPDPQHRRPYAPKQLEIRPDPEGNDGDHGEEEENADKRAAARTYREAEVADEQG